MSGLTAADSAIRVNKTLEEKVAAAQSQAEVLQIMKAASLEQGLVVPDRFDPDILHPVAPSERSAAPQKFRKTVVVSGVKHVLESDSELGLASAESALYKSLFSQPAAPANGEQPRDSQGRFVPAEPEPQSADEVARVAELELQFKRGDITAADYLERSGAIEKHEQRKLIGDWKSATNEFIHSEAARNYPGGTETLQRMYNVLVEQGWENNASAETLEAAWQILQQEDYENAITEKVNAASDKFALRDTLQPGSSLFGR